MLSGKTPTEVRNTKTMFIVVTITWQCFFPDMTILLEKEIKWIEEIIPWFAECEILWSH